MDRISGRILERTFAFTGFVCEPIVSPLSFSLCLFSSVLFRLPDYIADIDSEALSALHRQLESRVLHPVESGFVAQSAKT